MRHNKKGMTLMELVCGIALISIALLFGLQMWSIAARGTARGAEADKETQEIVTYFEGGALSPNVQLTTAANTVSYTLGGHSYTVQEDLVTGTSARADGTASQLAGLSHSLNG